MSPLDAWQRPLTHTCFALQHAVFSQQLSPDLQDFFPQQVLPAVAQNGDALVLQHCLPAAHLVFPQHCLPVVTQNGFVPVVQHVDFLPVHAGVHV